MWIGAGASGDDVGKEPAGASIAMSGCSVVISSDLVLDGSGGYSGAESYCEGLVDVACS